MFFFDLEKKQKFEKFKIFSMSQWQHRKGFDILLKAYYQEFFDQEDVELFIKTYRAETSHGADHEFEKKIIVYYSYHPHIYIDREIQSNQDRCMNK